MIRAETDTDWLLITHPDHAKLAGEFADAWGNDVFLRPEPFTSVRYAIYHHDDGWTNRDANPCLTPAGIPEAFTRELVGAYSAFEEIDLPNYLKVRGEATAAVAAEDATAGILVSMHTVNLLTEQADTSTILPEHREAHADFVSAQQAWQTSERDRMGLNAAFLQRGFEFLQACDNLSLIACSGYDEPRFLRHQHPDRDGKLHAIDCRLIEPGVWSLDPWPLGVAELKLNLPVRTLAKDAFADESSYRSALAAVTPEIRQIRIQKA